MGQVTATRLVRGRQRSGSPTPKKGWNGQADGVWGRWWRTCHTFSTHRWTHVGTNTETQTHTRTQGDMETDTQEHLTKTDRDTEWNSNPGASGSKAQPLSALLSKALEMKGHASCTLKSFPGLRYSKPCCNEYLHVLDHVFSLILRSEINGLGPTLVQGADSLTLSRWGEKQIASCFTPALNQVPAELEGREAQVAGLSNKQRTHPGRAGHRLPGSHLTPAPREAGRGVRVSPGAGWPESGEGGCLGRCEGHSVPWR